MEHIVIVWHARRVYHQRFALDVWNATDTFDKHVKNRETKRPSLSLREISGRAMVPSQKKTFTNVTNSIVKHVKKQIHRSSLLYATIDKRFSNHRQVSNMRLRMMSTRLCTMW